MANQFYDPKLCEASVGGKLMEGFADGTMIEITYESDDYEHKVGTKGDVGVARIYNPMVEIKLRLLQTSPSNDDLSALRKNSRVAANGGFASVMSIRDGSGTSQFQGTTWIKKPPTVTFSNGIEVREWTLAMIRSVDTIGGNFATP